MPQAPRKPRGLEKPERQTRRSQQPRVTPRLAKLLDQPIDFDAARRRVVDDYIATLRAMPPEALLGSERAQRAAGNLDLAAVVQAEIERRAKAPRP